MRFYFDRLFIIAGLSLIWSSSFVTGQTGSKRFLDQIRVLGVQQSTGEGFILAPDGTTRTWKKGTRVPEEGAVVAQVTRSTVVLNRVTVGASGERGTSLIVVRFRSSGRVRVREYSTISDAPAPDPPREEILSR